MQALRDYLNQYVSTLISDEDFEVIQSYFVLKKLRKKQYLLQHGEICKHMAFIVKGAARKFYLGEKGVEHVVDLCIENWWAGDRESFAMSKPTIYYIEVWEDSEVLLISRANAAILEYECKPFNEFVLKLDEKSHIAKQKRITSAISFTAKERYEDFAACYPEILRRFPQHVIASYLGITKDTLSRLRRQG
jgi:CRP-like cAMP-binding protein